MRLYSQKNTMKRRGRIKLTKKLANAEVLPPRATFAMKKEIKKKSFGLNMHETN